MANLHIQWPLEELKELESHQVHIQVSQGLTFSHDMSTTYVCTFPLSNQDADLED